MNFEKLLQEYRDITVEMISKINENADISFLIEKRKIILEEILCTKDKNDGKEKFEECYKILKINDFEEQLQSVTKNKMLDIRKDIKKLKQSQAAYKQYSDFNGNAIIFSTKI